MMFRRVFIHSLRVLLVVAILVMIRLAAIGPLGEFVRFGSSVGNLSQGPLIPNHFDNALRELFPKAVLEVSRNEESEFTVTILRYEAPNTAIAYALQTSPQSDFAVGYSGPTNCMIVFDMDSNIRQVKIIDSGDTDEHVKMVEQDAEFLNSFQGFRFEADQPWQEIDVVSGATLTSYAVIGAVAHRLGGEAPSLKFEQEPSMKKVQLLFPSAVSISASGRKWEVLDGNEEVLGTIFLTTPIADQISGYQGPTSTVVGLDAKGKCIGLVVNETYDNEPYASYLNDDYSFLDFYLGKTVEQLAELNPTKNGIDGVSGATMTSQAVAEAIPLAASAVQKPLQTAKVAERTWNHRPLSSYWPDGITIVLTLIGLAFSFTKLRQQKTFRVLFQVSLIIVLGFVSGQMLSQALAVGWARHGVSWQVAPGLVCLAAAAVLVPVFSKHQTYCQHLCPLGAIQQLGRKRIGWSLKLPKWAIRILSLVPWVLLALIVFLAIRNPGFNLASLEAFDGFAFRVAGWASISILIVGVAFSLVTPMAYCRYGCPTGAVLNFLKLRGDSHNFGWRDIAAVLLAVVGFLAL